MTVQGLRGALVSLATVAMSACTCTSDGLELRLDADREIPPVTLTGEAATTPPEPRVRRSRP